MLIQCMFVGLVFVQCATLDFLKSANVMIYKHLFHTLSFESLIMPTFLIISRHSPENCPINNEKMKKLTLELPDKLGGLEKKHGIKRVGVWTVIPEHLLVWVYEAPSSESLQEFSMDPEMVKWMAWNTSEIKLAMSLEESMKLLK
jgi:hypothetical protein